MNLDARAMRPGIDRKSVRAYQRGGDENDEREDGPTDQVQGRSEAHGRKSTRNWLKDFWNT